MPVHRLKKGAAPHLLRAEGCRRWWRATSVAAEGHVAMVALALASIAGVMEGGMVTKVEAGTRPPLFLLSSSRRSIE